MSDSKGRYMEGQDLPSEVTEKLFQLSVTLFLKLFGIIWLELLWKLKSFHSYCHQTLALRDFVSLYGATHLQSEPFS